MHASKHPLIHAVSWLAIIGGLGTMLVSLFLLHGTVQQQQWTAREVVKGDDQGHYYQVGEQRYSLPHWSPADSTTNQVYVNPDKPEQHLRSIPNYWWHLYLCMSGLIVLYAGLHLRRERHRNVQSLGFE